MEIALSRAGRRGYKPAHLASPATPPETAVTPPPDWPAALDGIDAAVTAALAELDRYEERWRETATSPAPLRPLPPDETTGWDDRLAVVVAEAQAADRDLAEWAEVVGRWRESLQRVLPPVGGESCHESR